MLICPLEKLKKIMVDLTATQISNAKQRVINPKNMTIYDLSNWARSHSLVPNENLIDEPFVIDRILGESETFRISFSTRDCLV